MPHLLVVSRVQYCTRPHPHHRHVLADELLLGLVVPGWRFSAPVAWSVPEAVNGSCSRIKGLLIVCLLEWPLLAHSFSSVQFDDDDDDPEKDDAFNSVMAAG